MFGRIIHKLMTIIHVRVIRLLRRISLFIIILYKLVNLIEVFYIKLVPLFAEVLFDRLSKDLRLICVSLRFCHQDAVPDSCTDQLASQSFNFTPILHRYRVAEFFKASLLFCLNVIPNLFL